MTDIVAGAELRSFIERIERLEEEKRALADDIKDVKAEAKGRGYDVSAINAIIKLRRLDPNERQEKQAVLEMYMNALGMTPMEAFIRQSDVSHDSDTGEILESVRTDQSDHSPSAENDADKISASIHERPSNRDVSTDGKAWAPGASQGSPVPAQAKAEPEALIEELPEPATHDGHSEGEAASAGLPTNQPETATKPGQHVESPVQRALADENLDVGEDTAKAETMAGAVSSNHSDPQEHVPSRAQAVTAETDTRSPSVSASNTVSRIRPYCQKPGSEECGGYGSRHCHACAVLIRSTQRESELVPAE